MRGKTVRPTPAALEFSRDIASEGSEGVDELVVRIGRVLSYRGLNANQPAQPPGGCDGRPSTPMLALQIGARGGWGRQQRYNRA